MTLNISNIKFTNIELIDDTPHVNFIADFIDDDELLQLNVTFRPNIDSDYKLSLNIDGQSYSDDIDSITESEYFDADTIAFIVSTARTSGYDC